MRRELSRRERQIMDVIYRRERATIAEILEEIPNPPTDSSIRATLRLLEKKKVVRHTQSGPQNVYMPTVPLNRARESALKHVLQTFFKGSGSKAMAAMLDMEDVDLTDDELDAMVEEIRRRKRGSGEQKGKKGRTR